MLSFNSKIYFTFADVPQVVLFMYTVICYFFTTGQIASFCREKEERTVLFLSCSSSLVPVLTISLLGFSLLIFTYSALSFLHQMLLMLTYFIKFFHYKIHFQCLPSLQIVCFMVTYIFKNIVKSKTYACMHTYIFIFSKELCD